MGSLRLNGSTSGSTTITAPATGSDESIELSTVLASKLDLAGGKILQVVRATDSTSRTTTSTSFVDVTGMSVTITPQKEDSAILLVASFRSAVSNSSVDQARGQFAITDNSNNTISGSELHQVGFTNITGTSTREMSFAVALFAYATPATTSAVTYKLRFMSFSVATTTTSVRGDLTTSQLFAVEVSA